VAELAAIRHRVAERSSLPRERTDEILRVRFARVPHRVAFALARWPGLATGRVLDVGASYATCLVHFGQGSVGIDNSPEAVEFMRSIGLDAELIDVDEGSLAAIPDGAFDWLWVSDILEHLEAPRLLLKRLRRKLRPAGRIIVHTSVLPRSRAARALWRRTGRAPFDAHAHYHQFTVEGMQHLLRRSGYRHVQTVVPVPAQCAAAAGAVPRGLASRVMLEAVPDPAVEAEVERFERKNKHLL
jgi:SAM-dependent methyltransferase